MKKKTELKKKPNLQSAVIELLLFCVKNWHQTKKFDYNTKTNQIKKKIYDSDKLSFKLTAEKIASRTGQENLASKSDIANFVKKIDFDDKLKNLDEKATSNKRKYLLVQNEF